MGNAPHHLARGTGLHSLAVVAVLVLGGPVAPAGAQVATTTSTIAGTPAPPPVIDDARNRLSGVDGGVPGPSATATAPTTVAGDASGDDHPTTTAAAPAGGTPVPAATGGDSGGIDPADASSTTTALPGTGLTAGDRAGALPAGGGRPASVTAKGTPAPVALVITLAVAAGLAAIAARWFTHKPHPDS